MIVGTSGHIDHGKTALVRALTGVDTDRLKEEKERGISIELGYAYVPMADGNVLGFVDVPGHERFVDHMVAGVTGIDFVLLVVAADDGPMPQTVEHLDILEFLDVRQGAVAITKIDRCDPARVRQCEEEVRALLAPTQLADAPVFLVSSVTGAGTEALMAHLAQAAAMPRNRREGAGFRLAVDRSFTLDGLGTVVTGTVFAGEAKVGDELAITPSGAPVRVRSIHAQNRPAQSGGAGERCALVLSGVAKEGVERGDWVVAPRLHAPVTRFDARLSLSAREQEPLRQWSAVHLHVGAAHVMARIALLDAEKIPPGGEGLVQVVPEAPIGALAGDAFIVRDASASRTIGGGRVIDPFGPARRRRIPARLDTLRRMAERDPGTRLAALLDQAPHGVDLHAYRLAFNLAPGGLALDRSARHLHEGKLDRAFSAAHWNGLAERLLKALAEHHAQRPDDPGLDLGRLHRGSFPQLDEGALLTLATELAAKGLVARTGTWWHLPGKGSALGESEQRLADAALPLIEAGGFDPPPVPELAQRLHADERELRNLLTRLSRRKDVHQVIPDFFVSRAAISRLAGIAREVEAASKGVRAAEYRDRIGLGRKRAIEILEYFDRTGYMRRAGDVHHLRPENIHAFDPQPHAETGRAGATA